MKTHSYSLHVLEHSLTQHYSSRLSVNSLTQIYTHAAPTSSTRFFGRDRERERQVQDAAAAIERQGRQRAEALAEGSDVELAQAMVPLATARSRVGVAD